MSYLLPFYLFRGQHLSQSYIEGLAPQLAVSALGVGRRCLSAPWPRRHDLRPAFAAEADGALQGWGGTTRNCDNKSIGHKSTGISVTTSNVPSPQL